jgi:drug/metabolite transporter superfamily protein YnfA
VSIVPLILVLAALLEVGGDAAIRKGLIEASWSWMSIGVVVLASYGFLVNTDRTLDFGRLMGLYIVVFFVVSQLINFVVFGARPDIGVPIGGGLIVAGGIVLLVSAK